MSESELNFDDLSDDWAKSVAAEILADLEKKRPQPVPIASDVSEKACDDEAFDAVMGIVCKYGLVRTLKSLAKFYELSRNSAINDANNLLDDGENYVIYAKEYECIRAKLTELVECDVIKNSC